MTKKKRVISGVLVFCMLFTLLHSVAFANPQPTSITVEVVETYGWWGPFPSEGMYVQLFSNGQLVASTFTDGSGLAEFDFVPNYSVTVTPTCDRNFQYVSQGYHNGKFFFHFFFDHVVI